MLNDYHIHTRFSFDSAMTAAEAIAAAKRAGLDEICFTEHVDCDETCADYAPADMPAYWRAYRELRSASGPPRVRLGVEIALKDEASDRSTRAVLGKVEPDFVIGSCHNTDMGDPYEAAYFQGRAKAEAYLIYLENILRRMRSCGWFHVLGHFDYVAKRAPYPERAMAYSVAPTVFDGIFRLLIERGQGMEYNTSAQPDTKRPLWGLDVLRRYAELGGEFVTFGSDAHTPERVGARLKEAQELAKAAGIRYQAAYYEGKPTLHRL